MIKTKLYSPIQIFGIAFVGGPLAAIFGLWTNFSALGNRSGATQTLVWGLLLTIVLLLILPFLPDQFPRTALPLTYSFAARAVASQSQMSKEAIVASDQYALQSFWNALGVSLVGLVVFVVIVLAWLFGLDHFGIISL